MSITGEDDQTILLFFGESCIKTLLMLWDTEKRSFDSSWNFVDGILWRTNYTQRHCLNDNDRTTVIMFSSLLPEGIFFNNCLRHKKRVQVTNTKNCEDVE